MLCERWRRDPTSAPVDRSTGYGVAERFNRTLKEQAIHGRVVQNVEEVREAVGRFVEDYNAHWRPEKLGFMAPLEARQEHAVRGVA